MKNQIPKNWQKVKLGEYVSVKGGKRLPAGNSVLDENTGHPYLRIVDMREDGLDISRIKYISGEVFKKISQYTITDEDLYISIAGTIGFVGKIPHGLSGANLTENCAKICNFSKELDRDFLLYFLRSSKGKAEIKAGTGGSSQPKLALSRIENFQVPLPLIELQKSIASILSSFDDKIEVNNKVAKTLEEMAQALFKEWFVHFRFPGYEKAEFVDSELGKIPKGWTVQNIEDICETFGGGTPSTNNETYWQDGTINWATPTDMTSLTGPFIFDTEKKITDKGLKNSSTRLLPIDSILITSRATVGILAISKIPICTNQGFITVVCSDYPSHYFMFSLMKNRLGQIRSLATGSTFPEISRGVFRKISVILPDKDTVLKFDQTVKPIFEKIANIMQENQKLVALRDLLLPKLMRGEIRV